MIMAAKKFTPKPVRVHAGAVPATDVPGHWLPAIVAVDPDTPYGFTFWNSVIPKMFVSKETAVAVAARHIEQACRSWKLNDGWRVAPDGYTTLPDYPRSKWKPAGLADLVAA
jgi:hypothetical protein